MTAKEYIRIISQKAMKRAVAQPRVGRKYRTKSLSKLTSFYRNRFYELDGWYKARIIPPEKKFDAYLLDHDAVQKSLEQRLADLNLMGREEQAVKRKVNIGFKYKPDASLVPLNRSADAEDLARNRNLIVDPCEIAEETCQAGSVSTYPEIACRAAAHYGVFRDCFHENAYFYPIVPLNIVWRANDGSTVEAHFGNALDASEASDAPSCSWQSSPDSMWTLICVNIDGNLTDDDNAIVHWMVQSGSVDYEEYLGHTKEEAGKQLDSRHFDPKAFYLKFEDKITPAGLAFVQVEWDKSCSNCFHQILGMEEPIFEYDFDPPHLPEQREYFKKQPFNRYLDAYRDEKDIEKELLLKRLKRTSPFKKETGPDRMENLLLWEDRRFEMLPWQHLEVQKEQFGSGKYKKLFENRIDE